MTICIKKYFYIFNLYIIYIYIDYKKKYYVTEISSTSLEHFVTISLCAICLEISFNINVYNSVYSQVVFYGVLHMTWKKNYNRQCGYLCPQLIHLWSCSFILIVAMI